MAREVRKVTGSSRLLNILELPHLVVWSIIFFIFSLKTLYFLKKNKWGFKPFGCGFFSKGFMFSSLFLFRKKERERERTRGKRKTKWNERHDRQISILKSSNFELSVNFYFIVQQLLFWSDSWGYFTGWVAWSGFFSLRDL